MFGLAAVFAYRFQGFGAQVTKEEDIKEEVKQEVADFAESAKLQLQGVKEEARLRELCKKSQIKAPTPVLRALPGP